MGEVFEAVRIGSGGFRKAVALKTLNPGLEPKSLERFLHECRITAQLEHPNIVRVYDLLTLNQRHYLVMELLRGRPLSAFTDQQQGCPAWLALSVSDQILDGLGYAHTFTDEDGQPLGIIHRDLTPRNLFVCENGTVKILDFGLAKMKDAAALALTQEGMVAGTPAYLSPEQANGLPLDPRTDLYQLGATLYELLTGQAPHGNGYLHEQLAHARRGEFTALSKLRPDLPPAVIAIVEKALNPDPAKRFPNARAMRDAVQIELARCPTRGPEALAHRLAQLPGKAPTAGARPRMMDGRAITSPEFVALGAGPDDPTSPGADRPSNAGFPRRATPTERPAQHISRAVPRDPSRDGRAVTAPELRAIGAEPEAPTTPEHNTFPPPPVPDSAQAPISSDSSPQLEDAQVDPDSLELPRNAMVAGRYRIERFLAKGGMGAVYEAEDLELREKVALKTIRPELAGDERAVERFKREIHLARRVTHPNVCRIFDIGFHSNQNGRVSSPGEGRIIFLTMELVEGETLAERLRRVKRMTTDEALPFVTQMALGLAAAHRAGVVHGDFKPENVVIAPPRTGEPFGRAVITDFGLARATASGSTSQVASPFAGSPAYMSPEQVEGQPVTSASDIYALGIVLYEMVTGDRPFTGDSPAEMAMGRLREDPPAPSRRVYRLDSTWEATILRCLERDPAKRFQTADEVVLMLGGEISTSQSRLGMSPLALSGTNHSALRPAQPPGLLARQVPARLLVLALAVLVVLVGGILWKVRESMDSAPQVHSTPQATGVKLRRSVAVLGFHNLSGKPETEWLSTALAETLGAELGAGGDLRTVPGEDVSRAKVELSIADPSSVGEVTLKRLGANVRADLVLAGAYLALGEKGGGRLRLDLQIHDVGRGEVVAKVSDSGTEAELLDLVSRTGEKLREQLGLSRLSMVQAGEVASTLPGKPDATRLYAEGLARLRAWDYLGARAKLEAAAEADPEHPLVQSKLSEAWLVLGDKVKGREAAEKAKGLAGKLSREERLWVEGLSHEAADEWQQAVQTYRQLWTFAPDNIEYGLHLAAVQLEMKRSPDEPLKTVAALRMLPPPASEDPRIDIMEARAAQASSDFKREREAAERAAQRAEKVGARLLVAQARIYEAWARSLLGDTQGGLQAYDEARDICEKAGQRWCLAVSLEGLGSLRSDMGELEEARTKLEGALKLRRELGAESGQLSTLTNLALVLQRQGDLAAARSAYTSALNIAKRLGIRMSAAYELTNLGHLSQEEGNLSAAEKNYQEAMPILKEGKDVRGAAECLAGLGEIQLKKGNLGSAEAHFEEGLATLRAVGVKDGMFRLLTDRGQLQRQRGDLPAARKSHSEALAVANELGEKSSVALARVYLAELALDEGRAVEAETLARQAVEEFVTQKLPGAETRARSVLALALLADKKLTEARAQIAAAASLGNRSDDRASEAVHRIASARVVGAVSGNPAKEAKALEADLRSIGRHQQLALDYEARLAVGQLEIDSGHAVGKKELKALAKEAKARQFNLVARKALAYTEK